MEAVAAVAVVAVVVVVGGGAAAAVEVVAVAGRSGTVVGGEEEPAALEEAHSQSAVALGCIKGCSADPCSAVVGKLRVDLFVLEVEADEQLDPSLHESCPLPPASP